MILLANFLAAIAFVLDMVLGFFLFAVIGRAIISWVNPDPRNVIVRFLVDTTEPFIRPIRRYIPIVAGRVDFAPLIFLLVLYFLRVFLVQSLADYALALKRSVLP